MNSFGFLIPTSHEVGMRPQARFVVDGDITYTLLTKWVFEPTEFQDKCFCPCTCSFPREAGERVAICIYCLLEAVLLIEGTSSTRIPSAGDSTERTRAATISSNVTNPKRCAVSRVAGIRSKSQYIGFNA